MRWQSFILVFSIHLACLSGLLLGGWWILLTPVYVFGVLPLLDALLPPDLANPDAASLARLERDPAFRRVLHVAIAADTLLLLLAVAWAPRWHALELVGQAVAVGIVLGGVGITVAHELLHRSTRADRMTGYLALLTVGYAHFAVEHVHGHHLRAATLEDPATARRGESLYAFLPRTLLGSWCSAWHLEAQRLGRHGAPPWSLRNQLITGPMLSLFAWLAALHLGGLRAGVLCAVQAGVAILLLEIVNYIEHYGLLRQRRDDRYEPFGPHHAWDADGRVSNRLLFRLSRHADHHRHARRPYQVLRRLEASPKMPAGYPAMMLLALLPPWWRRVMDPRLDA